jgi:hypothetical protein
MCQIIGLNLIFPYSLVNAASPPDDRATDIDEQPEAQSRAEMLLFFSRACGNL